MVSVGRPVTIRGVLVRPGDQIVADRDGVVVVPSLIWKEVKEAALAIAVREDGYLWRLRLGERIVDVLGLDIGDSRS
jgi:4-hydroxy-4-methyl-2-oxoglutarate aldolase